jgi:hypothetical protein
VRRAIVALALIGYAAGVAAEPRAEFMARLSQEAGLPPIVENELRLWSFSFRTPRNLRCARHLAKLELRLCRAVLSPEPDWAALLGDLAAYDVWKLPGDGKPPSPPHLGADVDALVVEARRDGRLRSYAYNGSGELNAERILEGAWSFVEQHVRGFR